MNDNKKTEIFCWCCDEKFEYEEKDEFTHSEIIEAQYMEFNAVTCIHCESTNTLN